MTRTRKKSLVGWVSEDWLMCWNLYRQAEVSIVCRDRTQLKNTKVRITIEEIGEKKGRDK